MPSFIEGFQYHRWSQIPNEPLKSQEVPTLMFSLQQSDFRFLKNGFGKCSLFVLSVNGWKDQNMASSFSRQRKP